MRRFVWPLIPVALGLALAVLWQSGIWVDPVLYLRIDLGTVFLLLGVLIGCASGLVVLAWMLAERRCQRSLACLREEQAEAHRRFLRRLDHELKNPITAIRAGLANLSDLYDGSAMSSVRVQVDRLARLTGDLRKLADLETQELEREEVNLDCLLVELLELARERPDIGRRQLDLSLPRAPWPLPTVAGDRDLIFLALHNLIDNALKFSQEEDTVEIRAFEDDRSVIVEVADTGPGIPEEDLAHLGEELYRGSAARGVDGSGLGLALVEAIVARHDGTVSVRSRVGHGTVVSVRLPVQRP
jgi:two-component system OmpR family sensor kinase